MSKLQPQEIKNDEVAQKYLPKTKRNIGCGILLIIVAIGALANFLKASAGATIAWKLGGLAAFVLFIIWGIRMIVGKQEFDQSD